MLDGLPLRPQIFRKRFSALTYAHHRARDRRDLILRIHETLLARELQRCRRLLHERKNVRAWWEQDDEKEDLDDINRALAMFDVLGYYVAKRWVSEADAIELWGESLIRAWQAGRSYIEWRESGEDRRLWPYFQELADVAEKKIARERAIGRGTVP